MKKKRRRFLTWILAVLIIINSLGIPVGVHDVKADGEYYQVTFITDYGEIEYSEGNTEYTRNIEKNNSIDFSIGCYDIKGKIFLGWSVPGEEDILSREEICNYVPTDSITITAVWQDAEYVEFDPGEGYLNETDKFRNLVNGYIELYPSEPSLEGFVLDSWIDDEGFEFDISYPVEPGTIYHARYVEAVTLTFDANGGIFDCDEETYNTEVGKNKACNYWPRTPYNNNGTAFAGWQINGSGDVFQNEDICSYVVCEDTTFTAVWADACSITFNGNGGFAGSTYHDDTGEWIYDVSDEVCVCAKGTLLNIYPRAEREGYVLEGYKLEGSDILYVDRSGDLDYNERYYREYRITDDAVFSAVWKEAYKITFNANGGQFYGTGDEYSTIVNKDEYISEYPIPTLEGKALMGYKVENDDTLYVANHYQTLDEGEEYLDEYQIKEDTTFTAMWGDACTVTFIGNGGFWSGAGTKETQQVYYCKKGDKIGDFEWEGYVPDRDDDKVFMGYKLVGTDKIYGYEYMNQKPTELGMIIGDYVVTGDVTFEAQWQTRARVWLDFNGGYSLDSTGHYAGRKFYGYDLENGGKGRWTSWGLGEDMIFNEYHCNLHNDDETLAFAGWKREDDDHLYNMGDRSTLLDEDTIFTAVWADAYAVKFDANGGYYYNDTQMAEYKTSVVKDGYTYEYPTPKRAGYVFMGYQIGDDSTIYDSSGPLSNGHALLSEYQITDDITFTAVWAEECTITFDANGGCYKGNCQTAECKTNKGGYTSDYPIPTLEGKVFRGYMIENDETIYIENGPGARSTSEGEEYLNHYIVNGDLTVTAIWEDPYTVTFDANGGCFKGGSQTKEIQTYKGGFIWDFPTPTLDGKVLVGYMKENDDTIYCEYNYHKAEGTEILREYPINEDVTFTAVWADACTVTFEIDPNMGYFGDSKGNSLGQIYEAKVGRGEKILDKYRYMLANYDTSNYKEYAYRVKGTNQVYYAPYAGQVSGANYIYDYVVNGDVTFELVFAQRYKVTYKGNGGVFALGPYSSTHEAFASYYVPPSDVNPIKPIADPVPVREGYLFDGWKVTDDSSLSGTVLKSLEDFIPTSDVTFEAVWRSQECGDLGHDLTYHEAKAATCTESGNSEYWSCDECDKYFSNANGTDEIDENSWIIPAAGHNYSDVIAEVPATCTTDGTEAHYECSTCHKLFVKNGDEYVETTEGALRISATGHSLEAHPEVAVTCTTDGNSAYWSCDKCNKYFSDAAGKSEIESDSWVIKATGHNWKKPTYVWKSKNNEWTCTATIKCANDDSEQIIEKVTAIGTSTSQATCTENGTTTYTATFTTNDAFTTQTMEVDDIEALGHDWGEPTYTWSADNSKCTATCTCTRDPSHKVTETVSAEVNSTATCSEAGTTTYTASFASDAFSVQTIERDVDALGHNLVEHPAVNATCTANGNTAYWSCDKCNKIFSDAIGNTEITDGSYIIPAKGHTKVVDPAVAATTTSTGLTEGSHCSVCGAVIKARTVTPKISVPSSSNKSTGKSTSKTTTETKPKYSEEWVDGKWYNKDGKQTYSGRMSWKSNSTGWWIEDSAGWYPTSTAQKIDGKWYYFDSSGYMVSNAYYNGYWYNSDGSRDSRYYLKWKSNSTGWWVEDKSGWWPSNRWLKIDGDWYYFNGSGYMATSQYVDGYWVGANGVCQ